MFSHCAHQLEPLLNEAGQLVALVLHGDHCTEHEYGIDRLKTMCGLRPNKLGISARRVMDTSHFFYAPGALVVSYASGERFLDLTKYTFFEDRRWLAHWDESFLAVVSDDPQVQYYLGLLMAAAKRKDLAIMHVLDGPFGRPKLILAIISKVSKDEKKALLDADRKLRKIALVEKEIALASYFKEHNTTFCALFPRWVEDMREMHDTKYKLVYWYNGNYHKEFDCQPFGWYTVEALKEWAAHRTGPVLDDILARKLKYTD